MKKETKGAGKPAPEKRGTITLDELIRHDEAMKRSYDTTQKRRQSRRREGLNEIAKASGFASWSAYETACLNGVAKPNTA